MLRTLLADAEEAGTILEGNAVPISTLLQMLQGQADRRILDASDLKGLFDFTLRFRPESTMSPFGDGRPTGPGVAQVEGAYPSLFTAIQEQLGLKLESSKAMIDVVVIDSVQKPAAN